MSEIGEGTVLEFPSAGPVTIGDLILGSGGSSYVHHATNMNGEPMAVKVVRANATPDGLTERVMTEINNPLGPSPHIVKPIDHLVFPSYGLHVPCLLFPFINADEVGKFLTKEQPSNDGLVRRLTVAQQMCQALLHVHENGYIHGDISPKNFLLNPESDEVYLIDFETLTKTDGARQEAHWANSDYMAPEVDQSKSKALSQASDVWSFALVLVEWLAPQVWVKDALDEGWAEKFNRRKKAGSGNVVGSILSSSSPDGLEHIWPWITQALSIDLRQRPRLQELCVRFEERSP